MSSAYTSADFTCPNCGSKEFNQAVLDVHMRKYCSHAGPADHPAEAKKKEVEVPKVEHVSEEVVVKEERAEVVKWDELPVGTERPYHDQHFYVNRMWLRAADRYAMLARQGSKVNVLLKGEPGTGKTQAAREFAWRYNRPFHFVSIGIMQEPREFFGRMEYSPDRGTYFQKSATWEACEVPRCVVLFDELNRAESPKVLGALFRLLSEDRATYVDDAQKTLKVAEGVIFMATINEGAKFVGTDRVDAALRERFQTLVMEGVGTKTVQKIISAKTGLHPLRAQQLTELVQRALNVQTLPLRSMLVAAAHLSVGASFREAVETGFAGALKEEQLRGLLQSAQRLEPEMSDEVEGWKEEEVLMG